MTYEEKLVRHFQNQTNTHVKTIIVRSLLFTTQMLRLQQQTRVNRVKVWTRQTSHLLPRGRWSVKLTSGGRRSTCEKCFVRKATPFCSLTPHFLRPSPSSALPSPPLPWRCASPLCSNSEHLLISGKHPVAGSVHQTTGNKASRFPAAAGRSAGSRPSGGVGAVGRRGCVCDSRGFSCFGWGTACSSLLCSRVFVHVCVPIFPLLNRDCGH